jgi:uncharacterized protein (DUF2235 family)
MSEWFLVFSDGTGQRGVREDANAKNSNVFRMYLAAKTSADIGAFYDPGIGAPANSEAEWLSWGYDQLSKASGLGISRNIAECYVAIMENAKVETRLGLFGFSRGAYTVRCVGGVLGLLGMPTSFPRGGSESDIAERYKIAEDAVEIYKLSPDKASEKTERAERAKSFRGRYACADKWPETVGVFDTVGALGLPVLTDIFQFYRHVFHDRKLDSHVKCGLQALAIDENRKVFAPVPWDESKEDGSRHLEQVWFPGVHSDIGGGYADDRTLADMTLAWMCERLKTVCGLDLGIDTNFNPSRLLGMRHDERTGMGVFWKKGERTGILPVNGMDDGRLCKEIEHRFQSLPKYRPVPAAKHPRVTSFY